RIVLQVSLLLAWAMPVVAAMTVWIWLFDRRRGVVNYLLDLIPGVHMNNFNWIGGSPTVFFMVASIIVIWMSVPFVAFSSYAGFTFGQGAAMAIFVLALTVVISWFYIRSLLKEDQA